MPTCDDEASVLLSPVLLSVDELVRQFIARTLPKTQWTHHAHLRVGLWHGVHYSAEQALDLLRERISTYNIATGVQNTSTAGYHETITRFYVKVIERFLAETDRTSLLDELAGQLITRYGDRELPLRYYSRECLFSCSARLNWVEPDLRAL